jgi:XTP/dITP diphosphohydrolase
VSREIVFASGNAHKVAEIAAMLTPHGFEVVPLALTVEEDAPTFAGNAEKKARAALAQTGLPSLADDSGLEVDALDGAPGVRSARYAADDGPAVAAGGAAVVAGGAVVTAGGAVGVAGGAVVATGGAVDVDAANNRKLLAALAGVPDERRGARFRCALVFVDGDGTRLDADGSCEGAIGHVGRGEFGFGYDPLFVVAGDGRTMAELAPEEKNRISHRARALAKMAHALARRYDRP